MLSWTVGLVILVQHRPLLLLQPHVQPRKCKVVGGFVMIFANVARPRRSQYRAILHPPLVARKLGYQNLIVRFRLYGYFGNGVWTIHTEWTVVVVVFVVAVLLLILAIHETDDP